ncbi:Peptidoglycan/LPS O-acetylase OafA/YrhL, contains acyltransferase and SGNH-hydrolase domains [Altererythrobacter xiamenensis]|uniref:Peptidoglycan/LPS O-acetylase OafA/YrhL, contains acyltransferase and SGNH-hydrolase domains n=1 Tax=Altererythrobacter xiamenensis TaxID=1316679 RepID=A0A1Y6EIM6_9SPHN|nr:acyltransferase [Altererythrobacter xiamenensis]SMQ61041.1 Peptidoglycan/LPS O-acetylase OafA/YrhL, contains acyltransferase and SGNH-hydrolase domains [Altererythrobacter xiamenensis]
MRYFWGLDLIRFISAVMVVLFHFAAFGGDVPAWPVDPAEAPMGWLSPYAWMGWIGVQIFFVLSGFVIAASARGSTSITFLKKRAIRLLPALWISACLALTARALWGEPLGELIPAFLRTLVLSPKGPYIDGVVWTLVVEAAFYLCVVVVIALASRLGGHEKALGRFAWLLGAASAAFTIVYWASTASPGIASVTGTIIPLDSFVFDVSLLRQGVFFALGMLLFEAIERGMTPARLAVIAALTPFCALQIHNNVGEAPASLVPIAIWGLATALIYLGARYGDRLVKRDMRPIMRPIGLMTYPLYLNHFVLGAALLPILANWIESSAIVFALLFAILLANAWVMAQYPERWIQRRLKRFLLEPREPASPGKIQVLAG